MIFDVEKYSNWNYENRNRCPFCNNKLIIYGHGMDMNGFLCDVCGFLIGFKKYYKKFPNFSKHVIKW